MVTFVKLLFVICALDAVIPVLKFNVPELMFVETDCAPVTFWYIKLDPDIFVITAFELVIFTLVRLELETLVSRLLEQVTLVLEMLVESVVTTDKLFPMVTFSPTYKPLLILAPPSVVKLPPVPIPDAFVVSFMDI